MATKSLGTLTLDLIAKIGGFVAGMDQAARVSEKRMKQIQATANKIGIAIGASIGVAAGAFTLMIKNALDTADELGNLSAKVGISVESLSELQFAAQQSDVTNESLTTGLIKLNDAIANAGNGAKSQSAAFAALGVSVKDAEGNLRNGHDVLLDVAQALSQAKDGAAKTAIVLDIFGKSGADLIPLLASGSDGIRQFEEQARKMGLTISTKTSDAADQFDKNLKTLKSSFVGVARTIAGEVAPALVTLSGQVNSEAFRNGLREIVKLAVDAATAVAGLVQKIGGLRDTGNLNKLVREQKYLEDTIEKRTNGRGALEFFGRDVDKELVDLRKRLSDVRGELKAIADTKGLDDKVMADAVDAEAFGNPKPSRANGLRDLKYGGLDPEAAKKAAEQAKKLAQAQAGALEAIAQAQANYEQQLIDSQLAHNLISYQKYYDDRLALSLKANQQEIDSRKALLAGADSDDKAKLNGEIAALQIQRKGLIEDNARDRLDAEKKLNDEIQKLQVDLLRATGEDAKARSIEIEHQYDDLIKNLQANGKTNEVEIVVKLKAVESARAVTDELQAQLSQIRDDYQRRLKEIDISVETGARTRAQALRDQIDAAKSAVVQESEIADQLQKQADIIGDPALKDSIADLRQEIVLTGQVGNEAFNAITGAIEDDLGAAIADVLDGTSSVKDAFKDLLSSIQRDINAFIAKKLSEQLVDSIFGGFKSAGTSSSGGGLSGIFGGLFGGGSSTASGGFLDKLLSFGGSLGGSASYGGARALGGPVFPGKAYLVGENGPEMFSPSGSGSIIPNGGGMTVNQSFVINAPQGSISKGTQLQIAAQAAKGAARGSVRNN